MAIHSQSYFIDPPSPFIFSTPPSLFSSESQTHCYTHIQYAINPHLMSPIGSVTLSETLYKASNFDTG